MWWNLPIEEVEELMQEDKLNTFTCVEYDENDMIEKERKERIEEENANIERVDAQTKNGK